MPFSAFSDWKYIGRDVSAWYFIDPVQISKRDYSRKVWIFFDPTLRFKDYDYSLLYHKEYDCKNERSRIIGTVTFPGFVPEGSVFFINPFRLNLLGLKLLHTQFIQTLWNLFVRSSRN